MNKRNRPKYSKTSTHFVPLDYVVIRKVYGFKKIESHFYFSIDCDFFNPTWLICFSEATLYSGMTASDCFGRRG
ncbi:MAG: hypothetical protein U9R21_07620, partial [Candidatus Thermoplasmatota archaeon]|nr:hypothetical protein [Candidatus Thermoplasmatota archaeon]